MPLIVLEGMDGTGKSTTALTAIHLLSLSRDSLSKASMILPTGKASERN
jgi:thymidylate kinase